jgi:pimeloyl-ACP methyl ester carboxylesterase
LEQVSKPVVEVLDLMIEGSPAIAATVSQGGGDTLCLFLHGIGGGRTNWLAQLQAIGPTMRAAALDLRGYGDSTLGPVQSTVDDYCADILRVPTGWGPRRLVLVGLSYGSWIATSFAMRHPDMLDGAGALGRLHRHVRGRPG